MRLKHLLKSALSPFTARIRGGALAGKRWVIASGSRFLRGQYEPVQAAAFQRLVRPGDVVFDVGAHVGFYTVLSSTLAGPTGRVFAFEPLPANLGYLRRHVALNQCTNVTIVPLAVGERAGAARFDDSHGTGVGHLAADGALEVQVASLDELVASGAVPAPRLIKMDVEGAEVMALDGAASVLATHHPTLILSVHSDALDDACRARLSALGYSIEEIERHVLVAIAR